MEKTNLTTRILAVFLTFCLMVPSFVVLANAAIEDSLYDLQYHSTLYYDAENPYNNVYQNTKYAYKCYTPAGSEDVSKTAVFTKDGSVVTDATINANLLKMYFAQNSHEISNFQYKLSNVENFVETAEARKLNAMIADLIALLPKAWVVSRRRI